MIFVTEIGGTETTVTTPKILAGPIDTLEFEAVPVRNLRRPVAIDFDPVEEKVYWSDVVAQTISRAFINGSNQEVIASSLPSMFKVEPMPKIERVLCTKANHLTNL